MGKRSRQRSAQQAPPSDPQSRKQRLRERADAASRVAEKQIKARPKAPWDPFPLTELAIFAGIVLLVVGVIIEGATGTGLIVSGVVLACIGGLETVMREHFGGYRSHAGTIAGILGAATLMLTSVVLKLPPAVSAAAGIAVFGLLFTTLRSSFIRKSGGRGVL
ncbi:MAG: hypothetical protein JHD02_03170 [Thermoleophilaceae bacterium]|nr:hypothetical protein [Thermoleophilaceae bacterium]